MFVTIKKFLYLLKAAKFCLHIRNYDFFPKQIWTASSEFGTYRLCEQRRFRRACASAQSRQNLRCSLIQAVSQKEPSDRKPDLWPLWMAGHAQLKFVMTECSKTQIRLTGLILFEFVTCLLLIFASELVVLDMHNYDIFIPSGIWKYQFYQTIKNKKNLVVVWYHLHIFHDWAHTGSKRKKKTKSNEPAHEIIVLFILRKLILQMCMSSNPVGLDVWCLVSPFVCFHTLCVWTAKALVRLCAYAGWPEPSLVAYVISIIIWWAGLYKKSIDKFSTELGLTEKSSIIHFFGLNTVGF